MKEYFHIQKNCKFQIAMDHLQFFKVYNVK